MHHKPRVLKLVMFVSELALHVQGALCLPIDNAPLTTATMRHWAATTYCIDLHAKCTSTLLKPLPLIGASLSEPHINGTVLCEIYVCMYISNNYIYMYIGVGTTVALRAEAHPPYYLELALC